MNIEELLEQARTGIAEAGDEAALDAVRVRFLGKKGELTALLKTLGTLDAEERPKVGAAINRAKEQVQEWIAAGKVVNPPIYPNNRARRRSPLETAIERGFHSLVKVLLQGGAGIESTGYDSPMDKCLQMRRFDLVQLLVEHGYDAESVSMEAVFSTWDPEIMEYFIERGADVEQGNPLASALCSRIRTALRILKRYKDRFPSFQEQKYQAGYP